MTLKTFDMTQEEKQLLIIDLCSRLPYKPRVRYYYYSMGAVAINGYSDEGYLSYEKLEDFSIYPKYGLEKTRAYNILPYLRPMSSMTEYELKEFSYTILQQPDLDAVRNWQTLSIDLNELSIVLDWLNKKMLDYRELIPMGLAIEAPEGMYKTE